MNISDSIEQCFSSAQEIIIDTTPDYKRGPSVIGLVCKDADKSSNGYLLLHNSYKDRKITLLIHSNNNNTLNISLVIKETADSINIKNLKFDKTQFDNFLKSDPKDQ